MATTSSHTLNTVRSADGTAIAFERLGAGDPVVVIGGATCDRARTRPLAEELARHFTVLNYDRRGRGDSGDTLPYSIERELEDLEALIAAAGGSASVYGHSSGAGLALHAAAHGLPIHKLVLHDAPYGTGSADEQRDSREYGTKLRALLADGRRGDAIELLMQTVGMPQEMIDGMRASPGWPAMEALAPTLAYDSEVMGDISRGGSIPTDLATRATPSALVLVGGADYGFMIDVARRLADAMPNARLRQLEGEGHVVAPAVLTPVLAEFLASRNT
jgi:pimeloyl-ACP methyl ester carboxylesterase